MDTTALLLSRLQFAFTISFHIIFPSFTIGLAAWLTVLEALHLATGRPAYRLVFEFWLKIFGVAFGLGVVSGDRDGIPVRHELERAGADVRAASRGCCYPTRPSPPFSWRPASSGSFCSVARASPPWFYLFSTAMVALGTTLSAFWIMVNNSWMQVPVGYAMENGVAVPDDWAAILFSPVVWVRFPHMLLAAYLTGAFCVAATGAWYLLRRTYRRGSAYHVAYGVVPGCRARAGPTLVRTLNGEYVVHYQPAKMAAIEARWHDEQPASEVLLAWPDAAQRRNLFAITPARTPRQPDQTPTVSTLPRSRARQHSAGELAAGRDPVLRFPDHGRLWNGHAGACLDRLLPEHQATHRAKPRCCFG